MSGAALGTANAAGIGSDFKRQTIEALARSCGFRSVEEMRAANATIPRKVVRKPKRRLSWIARRAIEKRGSREQAQG